MTHYFADWLNKLDALTDYEWRREMPVSYWRDEYRFDGSLNRLRKEYEQDVATGWLPTR